MFKFERKIAFLSEELSDIEFIILCKKDFGFTPHCSSLICLNDPVNFFMFNCSV